VQAYYKPIGFEDVEALSFQDNWHMKVVRLSATHRPPLPPSKIFLVLISARGWVDLIKAIVRPEGLCQWKMSVAPLGT